MTDSTANYRAISSLEDQAHHFGVQEARVEGDELHLTTEHFRGKIKTEWTYFLLGSAILLPWSVLFSATPFFLSRLADSPLYPTFCSYLSTVYTWTRLVCQFHTTITSSQSSPSRRIITSLVAMILVITSLCVSTFSRGTSSSFFAFTLLNAAFMAVATSYLCTAVFAGAALLGPSFLQIVLSGQAASTVVISAVQVASSVVALLGPSPESVSTNATNTCGKSDQAEEISARIFFGVSAIFLCITLIAYVWLMKQSFYKSAIDALESRRAVGGPDERTGLLANEHGNLERESNVHIYQVFKNNLIFMFSIAYVFAVTLAVYPAITARVHPVNTTFHPLLFIALHFLVFSIGDLLGRYSCSFPYLLVWSGKKILAMSLPRTLFIPLILFCNVDRPATTPAAFPIMIRSDILFMIILLTIGYTNGYVSSLALLAASSLEHNPRLEGRREDVDVAATLGGTFMIVGLAAGALSSFGVQAML